MRIGIGIDTGGTYTDAVAYDFDTGAILGAAKSLTTKEDLSVGIRGAVEKLSRDYTRQAERVALSTTLATNACVEDKGGQARLIFFGGEPKVIDENGAKYGLPPAREMYIQESFTKFSGEMPREPDWERFTQSLESGYDHCDGVGILETNAMRNGAFVEKKAKALFQQKYDLPVVCGHELFSAFNCLQRGAGTLLNARLFPIIRAFLAAIKKALAELDIHAPLVIVRSDGSLMSESFAALRPVETLLCGPAASAIGGARMTGSVNSLIVDMGGTTTDISLTTDGRPVTATGGVAIGKWKTFVNGLYSKTVGLGGDSAVHYNARGLYLETYRVTPLCQEAARYPQVADQLQKLPLAKHSHFLYEHYGLVKDISGDARYTDAEKAFCHALRDGPLPLAQAARAVGKDAYTLNVKNLLRNDVVRVSGLTPTDVMHLKGDFTRYDAGASRLAAAFAAHNLGLSVDAFCDRVYDAVKRKLYDSLAKALLENRYPHYRRQGVTADAARFIGDAYDGAGEGLLSALLRTRYTLVGVGAPIRVFLGDVAARLGTEAVFPPHYEVANALGAVAGSVGASCTVEIRPNLSAAGVTGYTVYGQDAARVFEEKADAEAYAAETARAGAEAEARRRGVTGELTVTVQTEDDSAQARDSVIYLGAKVTARAAGG